MSDASPPFLDLIPEDIRGDASFRDIKDVGNLARSFVNAQKLVGAPPDQVIRLAGADDAAAWNGIWNRLGRPEAVDGYQLADPAEIPAGLALSAEHKTAFAAAAHQLGLTQKQADGLYQHLNTGRIAAFAAQQTGHTEALRATETALKGELGQAYERVAEDGNAAVDHLDRTLKLGGKLEAAIKQMPAEARAPLFKAFGEIGRTLREDKVIGQGSSTGNAGALSPAEARQAIDALWRDQDFVKAARDRRHPGHQAAVDRNLALHEFLTPGAA